MHRSPGNYPGPIKNMIFIATQAFQLNARTKDGYYKAIRLVTYKAESGDHHPAMTVRRSLVRPDKPKSAQ
jgi:hypothetical protein